MPFKVEPSTPNFLGDSYENARKRFFLLERRFEKNPQLKVEYSKVIEEYLSLNHAVKISFQQLCHIIPHHAVIKESSTTTKLRTVFDASAATSNGWSLNERMHIGPTILQDLWAILIRWRLGKVAMTADIEKMYRQFWIHPEDAKFQQILWRNSPNEPLELYELQTVTFGTAAAPYLAIRALHRIAEENESKHPLLAKTIKECFYVDDYLDAFDSVVEALQMTELVSKTFESCGLNLRKWNSNASEMTTEQTIHVKTASDNSCSALGIQWNTITDQLSFKITLK